MALVLADRVKETTGSTGTGDVSLAGATTGFQRFADAVGDSNTTYYAISLVGGGEFEVGLGTYIAATNSLRRDTVFQSSNSDSLVDFSTGTKDVFVVYPSDRAVVVEGATVNIPNSATVPVSSGGTGADNASTARSNLGLGSIATQDANNVNLDGGSITGTDVDVSGATFTVSNDQISGDAINGGTATPTTLNSTNLNVDSGTLFVDSSSNRVGIGTTPSYVTGIEAQLHVDGGTTSAGPWAIIEGGGSIGDNISLQLVDRGTGSGNTNILEFGAKNANNDRIGISRIRAITQGGEASGGGDLVFETAFNSTESFNSNQLYLDNSGNVGIGTSSPSHLLDIKGDDDAVNARIGGTLQVWNDDISTRAYGYLSLTNNQTMVGGNMRVDDRVTSGSHIGYSKGIDLRGGAGIEFDNSNGGPTDYGNIIFLQNNDTNDDTWDVREAMRIDSSGNVGIGTSSPSSVLQVNGEISADRIKGFAARGGNTGTFVDFDAPEVNSEDALARFFRNTNTTGDVAIIFHAGDGTSTPSSLLNLKGGDSFFNATGGNVGIGTDSPEAKLEIKSSNSTEGDLMFNPAGDYRIGFHATSAGNDDNDLHIGRKFTSDSSFRKFVTVYRNGNVGIGDTTPDEALVVRTPDENSAGLGQNRYCIGVFDEDGGTGPQKGIGFIRGGNFLCAGIQPDIQTGGGANLQFWTGNDDNLSRRVTIEKDGDVVINESLSKGSGSFRIDHPLPEKSETHHLVHSFVESPRADNVYRGTATLSNGTAQVNLDAYVGMTEATFSALNGNIDVFLQNKTGWEPLKGEVIDNVLHVYCRDETATDTISWMVVGERQDQHMLDTKWTDEFGRPVLEPEKEIEQEIPDDE